MKDHSFHYPRRFSREQDLDILHDQLKAPRFVVELSKASKLYPSIHDRSYRHKDILDYIKNFKRTHKSFSEVDLDDFYRSSKSKTTQDFPLPAKRFYPKGFSIYVNESFIDESEYFCCFKLFFNKFQKKKNTIEYSKKGVRKSTWLIKPKTFHVDPIITLTASEKIKNYLGNIIENSSRNVEALDTIRKFFGYDSFKQKKFNRPFFTVFITIIQFLIFSVAVSTYGLAPLSLNHRETIEDVLMPDLNLRHVHHYELPNIWIGPRLEDMVHMGAKYLPCIKKDLEIDNLHAEYRKMVDSSGCCIFRDGSGCIQTVEQHCSSITAVWEKDLVCGLSEDHCAKTYPPKASWSANKSTWPICLKTLNESQIPMSDKTHDHMHCQLVGRPCCIGLIGICIMTTREYCIFKKGVFHQEAELCSHVSCMEEMCGMIPFRVPDEPDQFYRFFTSLLIVPGFVALIISVIFQYFVMRQLERITGTLEMTLVYIGSGVFGSMFSSIFMPYYVEAGPSGSHYGVLALLTVEVIRWNIQEKPYTQLIIFVFFFSFLFLTGLLIHQVDNWAHLGGFFYGIFPAILFRPIRKINYMPISAKIIKLQSLMGLMGSIFFFALLMYTLYNIEGFHCDMCIHFNCMQFTVDYCEGTSISLDYNSMMQTLELW